MVNQLTLTFEYIGPVHGPWVGMYAEIDGERIDIDSDVADGLCGLEVHKYDDENTLIYVDD